MQTRSAMFRRIALAAADSDRIRRIVLRTPLRRVALRFVAGADLAAALDTARHLNAQGTKATLNSLGVHVRHEQEAIAAADEVIEALDKLRNVGLDSHISVKLTKIGLDVDDALCRTQLVRILDRAAQVENFVRIDMGEAQYSRRTIELFEEMLERYGEATVGVVLQSYLRTHRQDVERLIARRARIRLVKGGCREPADIAYQDRAEIDAAFREDIEALLRYGNQPAIATHDPEAIAWSRGLQHQLGLAVSGFEFQMLYGIRRDLQLTLIREGYRVRCYVPYGAHFLGYVLGSMRRLFRGAGRQRPQRERRGREPA